MGSGERDWLWMVGAGALALVAIAFTLPSSPLCAWGRAKEERVPMKDVPEAVRAAAAREIGPLDDCTALRERELGKVRWEIEKTVEHGVASVVLSDAGEVIEIETPIAVATLPQNVRDAVAAAFPKAAVVEAESIETHGYEFTLAIDGKKRHVRVGLDGAIAGEKAAAPGATVVDGDEEDDDDERK
jgi:hypothetical protein